MKKPNVLIIADKQDVKFLNTERQSEHYSIFWKVIDYNKLHRKIGELQDVVAKHNIDFVMYSRNDQVAERTSIGPVTRKLGTGYSSFSGIDNNNRIKQMVECFSDFIECGKKLDFDLERKQKNREPENNGETFSLLFDTEQLGGVNYGLPRILQLLNKYDVKATFFVTNLMKKVYPSVVEEIQEQGHEVGLHGMWHEYLSGLSLEEQKTQLRIMAEDFGTEIHGVNFLGRVDENTVPALIANKMQYFVYPLINYYCLFSYPKLPTVPSLINLPDGNIWALPISVETYGSPWFSIKNMVDSTMCQSEKCQFQHMTILCHPFRDGNLQHIETTKRLLSCLSEKEWKSVTLQQLACSLGDKRDHFPKVGRLKDLFKPRKLKVSPPRTKQDFLGLIPQNLILLYRIIKRGHTLF